MLALKFRGNKNGFLIIIFIFLFINLSFPQNIENKITLKVKDKALGEIINMISDLGKVNFSYSPSLIPLDKKITIKAKNKTVREICDEIFTKNGIDYMVVEKQIVLKPHKKEDVQTTEGKQTQKEKAKYTISGYIKDKSTGEILIGATVYIKGTTLGNNTNAYGFYSLTLPEGSYKLAFSFIGYKNIVRDLELKSNQKISTDMEVEKIEMKAVEINVNNKPEEEIKEHQASNMKLSPKTLTQMPGFVGEVDIIKSLQAVPGIKSYGDGSALFYVRGGNSDQNFILLDEAPIYNPSHLFGFFSAFAPDAIKDIEAYKGDFPASYGGRLSSVIDIKSKDGNMKKLCAGGSIGLFTSNLSFEGPFKKDRSSFYMSLRKSNLEWLVIPLTNNDKNLKFGFTDFNTKLNFRIGNNDRLFLTIYGGKDEYSILGSSEINTYGISWENSLFTIRWNHIFNDKLFSNTTLYSSHYYYYLYLSKGLKDYWNSSIGNFNIKTDFTFYPNPSNTIKTGIDIGSNNSNPGNINLSDIALKNQAPLVPKYNSRESDFYISNDHEISKKFSLRYGFRIPMWQDYGETTVYYYNVNYQVMDTQLVDSKTAYSTFVNIEPRINITYSINKISSLKAGYSRTTQFLQLLSNSTSPFTTLEVWVPSGPTIKPQKADQFSLGYFQGLFKSKLIFSVEPFYKMFYNQIDYKDHANMLFNPLLEGELRFGKAWSYGTEFMFRKMEGKFSGWVGYTYSRTFKQIKGINNDEKYPAFYDRPHDVCLNLSYNIRRWILSAGWIYATGCAVSTPTGFYYYNGYSVPVYGEKNNDRLPDYHRLDLSVTYNINKPVRKYQHSFVFTIYNAYGRANPFSVNFNKLMTDNGKFVVPTNLNGDYKTVPTIISVSGVIPSISYNFKF
ncbi:MAG: TonB-dependent receptor [Bacteroidales bacterium]|nr:TonB-dependent receptor [Bacteroidales bacterium]